MNIKNFDDALAIAKAIRNLYNIEKLKFDRSISLPDYYPDTYYKYVITHTGPKYELKKRTEFFQDIHISKKSEKYLNHWDSLTEWLMHNPYRQETRIGGGQQKKKFESKDKIIDRKKFIKTESTTCYNCIPPCEENWPKFMYRMPWKLECLKQRNIESL